MGKISVVFLSIMFFLCLFGCGKKSGLEGKVVDGKGQPLAGVKLVAKQVQPIKGYEQFEVTTSSDGTFKFQNLFPDAEYNLITYTDGNIKSVTLSAVSGPESQTKILPDPLTIRFVVSKDGITVKDTLSGVMWARNANISGKRMNWQQAIEWVKSLDYGGSHDWRLPTEQEFEALVGSSSDKNLDTNIFSNVIQPDPYWTSDTVRFYPNMARVVFNMWYGNRREDLKSNFNYVWPVRVGQ